MSNADANSNALGYPLLKCKDPVPSDIQVSQDIVKDVGLLSIADLAKQYVHLSSFIVHRSLFVRMKNTEILVYLITPIHLTFQQNWPCR
jgi:hypothetical protein